jgi:hypothetical protein
MLEGVIVFKFHVMPVVLNHVLLVLRCTPQLPREEWILFE